jgi:hypothetical protein
MTALSRRRKPLMLDVAHILAPTNGAVEDSEPVARDVPSTSRHHDD